MLLILVPFAYLCVELHVECNADTACCNSYKCFNNFCVDEHDYYVLSNLSSDWEYVSKYNV